LISYLQEPVDVGRAFERKVRDEKLACSND
jgi:hypothetical protein